MTATVHGECDGLMWRIGREQQIRVVLDARNIRLSPEPAHERRNGGRLLRSCSDLLDRRAVSAGGYSVHRWIGCGAKRKGDDGQACDNRLHERSTLPVFSLRMTSADVNLPTKRRDLRGGRMEPHPTLGYHLSA